MPNTHYEAGQTIALSQEQADFLNMVYHAEVSPNTRAMIAWMQQIEKNNKVRLYNAAPDLLEACKLAEDLICGRLGGIDPESRIVLPALRAAIKKAEGRE